MLDFSLCVKFLGLDIQSFRRDTMLYLRLRAW